MKWSAIRDTGNQNIIVVPAAEQGQDESVLLNKGTGSLK
jgi:mannan endo-1,4-beta-mannosidase